MLGMWRFSPFVLAVSALVCVTGPWVAGCCVGNSAERRAQRQAAVKTIEERQAKQAEQAQRNAIKVAEELAQFNALQPADHLRAAESALEVGDDLHAATKHLGAIPPGAPEHQQAKQLLVEVDQRIKRATALQAKTSLEHARQALKQDDLAIAEQWALKVPADTRESTQAKGLLKRIESRQKLLLGKMMAKARRDFANGISSAAVPVSAIGRDNTTLRVRTPHCNSQWSNDFLGEWSRGNKTIRDELQTMRFKQVECVYSGILIYTLLDD